MADVFVSYVTEDRAIAEKIASGLEGAGFSVWWDRHIQGGVKFAHEIDRQIAAARVVIVLWSAGSQDSDWVRDEATAARDGNKLMPLRIDGAQPPLGFRQIHTLEFGGWNGDPRASAFTNLLASLRHLLGDGRTPTPVEAASIAPPRVGWSSQSRWFAAAAVAIVAALIGFFVLRALLATPTTNDGRIEIGAFEPMTKTDDLERFAKGVGDSIVRVFATNGIRAVALDRGGVERGAGSNAGAEFALRGTVDRDGENLVVSTDILHRREGLVLWSTTTQGDAAHSRMLQEQFSISVASALRCALDFRKGNFKNDPSTDLFAKVLQICAAWGDGQAELAPEIARRIVEAAPQYAGSHALQAFANAIVGSGPYVQQRRTPPAEIARLRKIVYDSAQTAFEMDPNVDSYFARAIVDDPAVGLAERERLLQRSLAINPAFAAARYTYGYVLEMVGRIGDARVNIDRSVNDDPLDKRQLNESAFLAAWLGDIDGARRQFEAMRGKQLTDAQIDYLRFWAELWFGDPVIAKKINEDERVAPLQYEGYQADCQRAFLSARANQVRLSEEELNAVCTHGWELGYGYFGYVDAVFRQLEQEADSGLPFESRYLFMPYMAPLRADARFMPYAARVGLVDYWLDSDQWPDFCTAEKLPYNCKEAALAARAGATR